MIPKLTAYALGELSEGEAAAIENAITESAEADAWVAEVRALAATMRAGFGADLVERKRLSIIPLPTARSLAGKITGHRSQRRQSSRSPPLWPR